MLPISSGQVAKTAEDRGRRAGSGGREAEPRECAEALLGRLLDTNGDRIQKQRLARNHSHQRGELVRHLLSAGRIQPVCQRDVKAPRIEHKRITPLAQKRVLSARETVRSAASDFFGRRWRTQRIEVTHTRRREGGCLRAFRNRSESEKAVQFAQSQVWELNRPASLRKPPCHVEQVCGSPACRQHERGLQGHVQSINGGGCRDGRLTIQGQPDRTYSTITAGLFGMTCSQIVGMGRTGGAGGVEPQRVESGQCAPFRRREIECVPDRIGSLRWKRDDAFAEM